MTDIISICRTAWQKVKRSTQPDYDDLTETYRSMLTARAEAAIAAGTTSADVPFQAFEQAAIQASYGIGLPTEVLDYIEVPVTVEDGMIVVPTIEIETVDQTEALQTAIDAAAAEQHEVVEAAEPITVDDIVPTKVEAPKPKPKVTPKPPTKPKPPQKAVKKVAKKVALKK